MNFDRHVARLIDHTILKPEAVRSEVEQVCLEALTYEFASVCVNPCWVPVVAGCLKDSPVEVCTVIGFPLGAATTKGKVYEVCEALSSGAREMDMVINIGALKGGEMARAEEDILGVVQAAHEQGAIVKVILETALLTDDQKVIACEMAVRSRADFVKTSTGFGKGGATTADVALMRRAVGRNMGVKASGGVRTLEDVRAMVSAGASRIGASASVKIMEATETL